MTRRLARTALPLAISLALSALVLRAVPALPTYGAQQPQFQLPNVNNSLLLLTATADFNCDGLTDVILVRGILGTNTLVPVSVMLANGAGGFIDGTAQIFSGPVPQPMWPRKLIVDDFNGDGHPDVFIADAGNDGGDSVANGNQNTLLLSTAGCQLTNATANLPQQSDYTHSVASADIDNDGLGSKRHSKRSSAEAGTVNRRSVRSDCALSPAAPLQLAKRNEPALALLAAFASI